MDLHAFFSKTKKFFARRFVDGDALEVIQICLVAVFFAGVVVLILRQSSLRISSHDPVLSTGPHAESKVTYF